MSDEQKKKRAAVQTAWRLLTIAASDDVAEDGGPCGRAATALVAAFPEYLGPAA